MVEDIKGIADISGFGEDYEEACQKMLQAGWEWLNTHKEQNDLKGIIHEGIYGIFEPNSKDAEDLSNAVVKAVPDCSGAMHQAVMSHLFFINKEGLDKWKSKVKED